MKDSSKTNQDLLKENVILKQKIHELELSDSERACAGEMLKRSEAQYRLLADHMKDQMWLMDLNLKPTYSCPSVEKLLGYTFEEIAQLPLDKQFTATSFQSAIEFFSIEMPEVLAGPTYFARPLELEFYCKDDSTLWVESTFSQVRDKSGKLLSLLGVGRNTTDRKRADEALRESEQRYRELSIVDGLTQLHNSRHFYHQLKMEIDRAGRYGRHLTLFLLDLDDFKAFNDTYDHVEGDQVLW